MPPTREMVDTITTIMIQVVRILAIATKEIEQGRTSKFLRYEYVTVDMNILRKVSKEAGRKN